MNLTAHHLAVVYECTECDARYLGHRQCPNLPRCAEHILVTELDPEDAPRQEVIHIR